jgi:hypothetical protein
MDQKVQNSRKKNMRDDLLIVMRVLYPWPATIAGDVREQVDREIGRIVEESFPFASSISDKRQ